MDRTSFIFMPDIDEFSLANKPLIICFRYYIKDFTNVHVSDSKYMITFTILGIYINMAITSTISY